MAAGAGSAPTTAVAGADANKDAIIHQFASLLAGAEDDAQRSRLISRAKMLGMNAAPEEAFEAPIQTLGDYMDNPIEVPPALVDPFIVVRGGITCTLGRAGKGKTVMNLNRILKWAAGRPLFEGWTDDEGNQLLAPTQPLRTLVIENEGSAGMFQRQLGIMLNAEEFMDDEARKLARENILIWGDGGYSALKLDDPQKVQLLRQGCEKWKPDIVFVEPFRGLWSGEENSATEMAVVVDAFQELATDFSCGVMLAHHERKSGVGEDGEKMSAGRGSTVLEGAVTVMENFEAVKGGEYRELSWSKARHGGAPNPVRLEWVKEAWWYKWVPSSDISESVITALRGNADEPMTTTQLCEELNEKAAKLRPILKNLAAEGKIKKMPSVSSQSGSTGNRWRLPTNDNTGQGGLSI